MAKSNTRSHPGSDFVHLHVHSDYSLLDGACKVEALVQAAAKQEMGALALTDHGALFGAIEFYSAATEAGIKPIIGYEAYVAPGPRKERDARGIKDAAYHLTLLAADERGYRNLLKLASAAYLEGFYYKPRIDKEILAEHSDGLIGLSGCLKSEISDLLLKGMVDEAAAVAGRYQEMFGKGRFFLELQENGTEAQRLCLQALLGLAKRLGLPVVATNDIHYMRPEDARAHDALLCINTGKSLADADRMSFESKEYYFKSSAEMAERFREIPEAIRNTGEIAEMCNLNLKFGERHFPQYHTESGKSDVQLLRELCEKGLRERFHGKPSREVVQRLEHELNVIQQMGYASYFLIVWDFVHFAKRNRIPTGLRGSGASSLAAYTLYLTDINPLKHDLIFERFLDPQRKEAPDLDIDLCELRREEVLKYVKQKYGTENTAQIITFGTMAARAVVRDVGRVLGIPLAEVDSIAKQIPTTLGTKLKDAIEMLPELRLRAERDPRIRELFDISLRLEGLCRHASTHAAGMVISDRPLTEYVPLYESKGVIMTQYAMNDLEKVGLLKMDFLGLRTLTIVDKTLDLIEQKEGVRPELGKLPLDDKATYTLLGKGDTSGGVFQLGSAGMQELLRRHKPKDIEDVIAVVALYRPGPLKSGLVDQYIARRHGKEPVIYPHKKLEPILKSTQGMIVYQEQIMRILNSVAGMSMADALTLIKAISKKKADVIEARRGQFMDGARKNGLDEKVAAEIFEYISNFAEYGFNKAHATSYAYLAYYTAYLKAHYPVEFMAAGMTSEMNFSEKIAAHVDDCRRHGVEVLPPSVNKSEPYFTVAGKKAIRFGLGAVRNVGERTAEAIAAERRRGGPYRSLFDFCERIDPQFANRQAIESLIKAGAFDELGGHRAQILAALDRALRMGGQVHQDRKRGQKSLFGDKNMSPPPSLESLPAVQEWPEQQLLAYEKEALGFYMSRHPLARHAELFRQFSNATTRTLAELNDGALVVIGGMITHVRLTMTKRGDTMAHVEFEDLDGTARAVAFPETYQRVGSFLRNEAVVFLRGKADLRMEQPCIQIAEVIPIEEAYERLCGRVTVALQRTALEEQTLCKLRDLLKAHRGQCPVYVEICFGEERSVTIQVGEEYRVQPSARFCAAAEKLLGAGHVRLGPNGNGGYRRSPDGPGRPRDEETSNFPEA